MQSFRLKHSDKMVWVFLTGVVVILGIVVFLTVKGQNLFEKRLQYRTVFRDGGGLSTGTAVTISGMEVGMVRQLNLNAENNVEVTFEVMERFADRIREDSTVGVQGVGGFGGLVGGGGLIISVGSPNAAPLAEGAMVRSEDQEGLGEMLERWKKEGVIKDLLDIVDQINILLRQMNNPEGPLMKTLTHVEVITQKAESGGGIIGGLTNEDSAMYKNVIASIRRMNQSMANVEQTTKDTAVITKKFRKSSDDIDQVMSNMKRLSRDFSGFATDMKKMGNELEVVPGELRTTIKNMDARIDDLGEVIATMKNSIPGWMRSKPVKPAEESPEKKTTSNP
ncbi:MAG: hypothetical protein CMH56_17300 [Myxococcales bacterium]|nr:hypothetical protein [Myxococcales bacterium]